MSIQKVNHNVIKPLIDAPLTVSGGATPSTTTEWLDTNGWTDKVVTYEVDSSGSIALTLTADISPQHYYELNNKTATTDDYVVITIASAASGAIAARVDASDLDDLQRPFRSMRLKAANGDASAACTVTAYIEGWS